MSTRLTPAATSRRTGLRCARWRRRALPMASTAIAGVGVSCIRRVARARVLLEECSAGLVHRASIRYRGRVHVSGCRRERREGDQVLASPGWLPCRADPFERSCDTLCAETSR
jgi:hypothetical protein